MNLENCSVKFVKTNIYVRSIAFLNESFLLFMLIYRVATHLKKNFSRFLKIRIFRSIFSSLRLKTVLNSIKTLKIYCKATLNMFFNKENFDDDKKNLSIG